MPARASLRALSRSSFGQGGRLNDLGGILNRPSRRALKARFSSSARGGDVIRMTQADSDIGWYLANGLPLLYASIIQQLRGFSSPHLGNDLD
jgi:hypothetical protein